MKNYVVMALLLLLASNSTFAQLQFTFSVDGGQTYTFDRFSQFIEDEIRERFTRNINNEFTVSIKGKTSSGNTEEVKITMESLFLYLTEIDGMEIESNVSRYTNDPVELSIDSFQKAFDNSLKYSSLTLRQKQEVLKIFAFILAETARFEDVENTVNNIIEFDCTFQWEDYLLLLRRWKTISIFANSTGDIARNAEFGGSRAILIVPITEKNVLNYDNKVERGWRVVRRYGNQVRDEPVNIPNENQCAL